MKKGIIISCILLSCLLLSVPIQKAIFADTSNIISRKEQHTDLTQEQARELLLKYNNKLDYEYQGDENTFTVLKSKNLSGYVFLPTNIDTDMGYFVDKTNSNIYYFHPSGYLELIK